MQSHTMNFRLPTISERKANSLRAKTQNISSDTKKSEQLYFNLMKQRLIHRPHDQKILGFMQRTAYIKKKNYPLQKSDNYFYRPNKSTSERIQGYQDKKKQLKMTQILEVLDEKHEIDEQSRMRTSSKRKYKKTSKHHSITLNQTKSPIKQQRYQRIITCYEGYHEKIERNQMTKNNQQFAKNSWEKQALQLLNQLKLGNIFFGKLSDIVGLAFLKIGRIRTINERKYLYHQDDAAHTFFIILWGQFKLKNKFSRAVKYCVPGDTLGEEILIQRTLAVKKRMSLSTRLINGMKPRLESAKALTKSGLLEMSVKDFERIKKQLSVMGEKDNILLAEKMISWGLSKKASFRKN